MKNALIVTCALLFVSVAGFADGPAPGPVSDEVLSAILGEPLAGASCGTRAASMNRVSVVQNEKTCTATVTCLDGTTRSCTTATGTCTAVNPNCPTTGGSVNCNGAVTSCPGCCTGGTLQQNACCRCDATGSCMDCCRCDGGTLAQCRSQCIQPL